MPKKFPMELRKKAVRLLFEGNSYLDTAKQVFEISPDAPPKEGYMKSNLLRKWMEDPEMIAEYRKLQRTEAMPRYAKAMNVLEKQLGSRNEWVAQGAAREIATRFEQKLMGAEETEIVVRIEGAPELGEPDDD